MAPKKSEAPPTTFFGPTKMTLAMLGDMEKSGMLSPGLGRVPPKTDVYAKPREDEVVVFKDFFSWLVFGSPSPSPSSTSSLDTASSFTR